MKRTPIDIFIVEEHHEAYIVWKYAVSNQLVPGTGNTLLHIDEHSDMGAPILETPLRYLNGDFDAIKRFTYDELSIATFIVPAIYERLFTAVYWIRQRHNKASRRANQLYVRAASASEKRLVTGQLSVFDNFKEEYEKCKDGIANYKFYKLHIDQLSHIDRPVLDIDLDYFSCTQDPLKKALEIQITKTEFDKFNNQPYHRVRYFDVGRVQAVKEGDDYYFKLNYNIEPFESPLKVSGAKIEERIDQTIEALKRAAIVPRLITICRSRFSGYTPEDQWESIESNLLEKLKQNYEISSIRHVSSLGLAEPSQISSK